MIIYNINSSSSSSSNSSASSHGDSLLGLVVIGSFCYAGYSFVKWCFTDYKKELENLDIQERRIVIDMVKQCTETMRLTNLAVEQKLKEKQTNQIKGEN